ncbi:MAG: redoxin domain-containing protein [Pseudomonadota bacterium]
MNMRNIFLAGGMATAVCLTVGALVASTAAAQTADLAPGMTAPGFTGTTSYGETVSLSDFEGQTVVLEWTNHDCPFVRKHYDAEYANMQGLQAEAGDDDVVWLTVISSAPGKQGHVSAEEANALSESRGAAPTHVILDESGDIGRLYGAKTTPHMYVVEADGELAYNGAIDSISSARARDIPDADPYVEMALASVSEGASPDPAATKPYGCSVKY